jgi:membrane-associated phospholipid phosphatase
VLKFPFSRSLVRHSRKTDRASYRYRPALEALEERSLMSADIVLTWNEHLLDAIRVARTAPPVAARAMAIVHTSIYDAVNAIDRTHEAYRVNVLAHPRASQEAAVAAAAHRGLVALFPGQQATFDAALASSLASIPDGPAEEDGIALGQLVAEQILGVRSTDGSGAVVPYAPGPNPGDWRPTPPGFLPPALPQWADVTPWALNSGSQVRPAAPPALGTEAYATAFNEVKAIGAATGSTRTPEQSAIALFWANGPGTSTPPGHWNVIAQIVAQDRGNSLVENARLFALLNIALADAAIVSWDAKYEFSFWRPIAAIREAADDGNDATSSEATWSSFLITPPFPAYTSGHSTFSGAGAAVLAGFFGTDNISFVLPSEDPGAGNRSFGSFSAAAAESGVSRIFGGIHFSFDNTAGLSTGQSVGELVVQNFLKPRAAASVAGIVNGRLIVSGSDGHDVLSVDRRDRQLVVLANGRTLGTFDIGGVSAIIVDGRDGNDVVSLSHRIDIAAQLYGGRGNDLIQGGSGDDRIFGEEGDDVLFGHDGDDCLSGGDGDDFLFGGNGSDLLRGGLGDDWLFGDPGLDILDGGPGRNRLLQ